MSLMIVIIGCLFGKSARRTCIDGLMESEMKFNKCKVLT